MASNRTTFAHEVRLTAERVERLEESFLAIYERDLELLPEEVPLSDKLSYLRGLEVCFGGARFKADRPAITEETCADLHFLLC